MTQPQKRAASQKGGGSRSAKTFTFRGLKLQKPSKLPDSLGFDIGDIQLRLQREEMAEAVAGMQGLLEDLLGRQELLKVRPTVKGTNDPWQRDLLEKVLSLDGLDLGEA